MSSTTQGSLKDSKEAINEAGKLVDKYLNEDKAFYELSGLLGIATDKHANLSGHLDSAYPALNSSLPALVGMPFLGEIDHTPLPQELLQEFENMQCNSAMGLMPLIKRAWLTIDSTIYVWNYENGRDLAYFDGLKEVILGVGLIVPKPNVFQDHIQYLLCLTTPQEIVILGVSFANSNLDPFGEMHLLPEPLFALPSDNTCMLDVVGTSAGRIFLGGKDGCLYEILYQAEEGWFSRKCRKINHSSSVLSYILPAFLSFSEEDPIVQIVEDGIRNTLYTRSEKGTIKVYDLGASGNSLTEAANIAMDTIRYRAAMAFTTLGRRVDRKLLDKIVHISVIPCLESSTLHLLAVTQAGVRLYFTTTPQGKPQRPSLISLVHVRLPPGYCPSNAAKSPGNDTHQAFYRKGCLLLASSQTDDRDLIWLVEPDSFPFQYNLRESFITYPLNGRTWTMAESIEPGQLEATDSLFPLPPSIVTQHSCPPRRFVLLSTEGSYIITKLRPVDQLQSLLEQHKTGCCEPVEAFFGLHGDAQTCAMCLILATGPNKEVAHWAAEAYLKFGGEPHFIFPTTLGPGQFVGGGVSPLSPIQSTPIGNPQTPIQSSPYPTASSNTLGRPILGPEIQLSGKHDGMCLYLARLLSQLWDASVAMVTADNKFYSRYDSNELSVLAEQLIEMRDFLDSNIDFFTPPPGMQQQSHSPSSNIHQRMLDFMRPAGVQTNDPQYLQQSLLNKYKTEAYLIECNSLQSLHHLITQCCECLLLWKLICEHQFEVIADHLNDTQKVLLASATFKSFVEGGKELSSVLIKSLLSCHERDSSITDSLMKRLRQIAPSLYSQEDEISSKADSLVELSRSDACSPVERLSNLRQSLKLYSQVVGEISLSQVCGKYRTLRYYEGVIELATCTASHVDPQNMALLFYRSGQPPEDTLGQEALSKRQSCYMVVMDVLAHLLSQSRNTASSSVPTKPGPPAPKEEPKPDPLTDFNGMLTLCLRSDDELFHVSLYSWLLSTAAMPERLVEIKSPYIEEFLKYTATLQHQDTTQIFDLLWRFYEKNRNYLAAAKILDQLAHKNSEALGLDHRLDYMSKAVMCAKSSGAVTSISGEGEFLHELEEKVEVARVQLTILEALRRLPSSRHIETAIAELNGELMDVSKLYGDYAEPFDLPECKLAIVHLAGHHDPTLIETLWREIIEQELESTLQQNNQARMISMKNKLTRLGQLYSRNERYFPTMYLIKLLEQHSCQLHWEAGLVPQIFYTIGVSYPSLFTLYHTMFTNKDSFWQAAGRPLHVLSVIVALLTSVADNPSLISSYERSSFLANVLNKIGGYLVEVQTLNPTTPNLTTITTGLRDLSRKISIAMKN